MIAPAGNLDKPMPGAILAHSPIVDRPASMAAARWPVFRLWQDGAAGGLRETDVDRVRVLMTPGNQPVTGEMMDGLPALRLITAIGAGYEGVDIAAAKARGISVTNASGAMDHDIADWVLGVLIFHLRGIAAGDRFVREGAWLRGEAAFGPSLSSRTIGIIGLGGVGLAIAERCAAVGMKILWWGPRAKPVPHERVAELRNMAERSDALVLACPLNATTWGLVDAALLEALGPSGYLVNVSRGQTVDELALVEALREGRLGGAALDVFESEPTPPERWSGLPNVILGPHRAGGTRERLAAMYEQCVDNIARHFERRPLRNRIV